MTKSFQTQQENFWAGDFGDEYCVRNVGRQRIASRIALYSKILAQCNNISSLIEFGANIGLNLMAIRSLLPDAKLAAIEINKSAVEQLQNWGGQKKYITRLY